MLAEAPDYTKLYANFQQRQILCTMQVSAISIAMKATAFLNYFLYHMRVMFCGCQH